MIRVRYSGRPLRIDFRADQSLAHIAESLGVPRLEVGAALVDGEDWDLRLPPPDGSLVELLPLREPLEPSGELRFLLDAHLGRLARHLRLLGFDVAWKNGYEGLEILRLAAFDDRTVLTRNRSLLFRREFRGDPRKGMLVRSRTPWEQLVDVCRRFGLASRLRPFRLCSSCGSALIPVRKEDLRATIPRIVAERYDEFFTCPSCGKVFWKGDHFRNLGPFLERLGRDLGE